MLLFFLLKTHLKHYLLCLIRTLKMNPKHLKNSLPTHKGQTLFKFLGFIFLSSYFHCGTSTSANSESVTTFCIYKILHL